MKPRRSAKTAVIWRRWPARSCSPSALEINAAIWGDTNRASSVRWRSIVSTQPGVLDGDGNLLGEGRDEQDLGGRERPDFAAAEADHPDDARRP